MAAWGITTDGKPVFIGLAPAGSESTDAWADFLGELKVRGLRPPLLAISDGAPGLISVVGDHFPPEPAPALSHSSLPQRDRQGA